MEDLKNLRKKIDDIDYKIIDLLDKRNKIALEIGDFKKNNSIKILQKDREIDALSKREKYASKFGFDQMFISKLFTFIFSYSRKVQRKKKIIVKL